MPRLRADEWGNRAAPPVVCLHGVTGFAGRFRRLAERLADRFRVVSLDLRGHGRSGWEPPWDIDTHVADVLKTADALGIQQAVWVGHSFGGRLVAELAARTPERVKRAILLDPALYIDPQQALTMAEDSCADLSFATPAEAVEARLASGLVLRAPREVVEEEVTANLVAGEDGHYRNRHCRSAVVTAYGEMAAPPPGLPDAPLLVVLGEDSWLEVDVPSRDGLELVTVPGGHVVLWDAFEETAEAIERFLR